MHTVAINWKYAPSKKETRDVGRQKLVIEEHYI
jgi:hypothetical protein